MRNRAQHHITSFKHLCFLFNAGGGQFHFFNTTVGWRFNIKFRRILSIPNIAYASVCFTYGKNTDLIYYHLGRYNFATHSFELRTEQNISHQKVRLFVDSITYILDHINTGTEFPPEMEYFHSGHCSRCGTPLYNVHSLQLGLGPECEAYNKAELEAIQFEIFPSNA